MFVKKFPFFFWQFFSWNQSCQQLKSPKPQHFHQFFTPKKSTIFSGNLSWIFGQKVKSSNSVRPITLYVFYDVVTTSYRHFVHVKCSYVMYANLDFFCDVIVFRASVFRPLLLPSKRPWTSNMFACRELAGLRRQRSMTSPQLLSILSEACFGM